MHKRLHWPVLLVLIGLLCAGAGAAPSAPPAPGIPTPATGPANAASKMMQAFLDGRLAGNDKAVQSLFSTDSKKGMPVTPQEREKTIKMMNGPEGAGLTPEMKVVLALFLDFNNSLNYKFRVLGPATDNPSIVLLRAYQVGTPLTETKILKIVTVPDPAAGGAPRIDAMQTITQGDPAGMAAARSKATQAASESNLKQISLGILMYTQDHNNKLPDADTWVDEIMPYVKTETIFHDPSTPADQKWSYAFNKNLSGVPVAGVTNPSQTVMLFDSTLGTKNASDTGQSLPQPGRHSGRSDIAFADGHVTSTPASAKLSFTRSGP